MWLVALVCFILKQGKERVENMIYTLQLHAERILNQLHSDGQKVGQMVCSAAKTSPVQAEGICK
jgi:cytidine deaminase